MYKHCFKRFLDFFVSGIGILLLSPLFFIICLAVKLDSEGPVFFRQKRLTKNKRVFNVLKFRTMYLDTPNECPTRFLEDADKYITRTGKFLRRTSLDELPQLFNIFTGKMSLVGPRPILYSEDDLHAERDKYGANTVRPGLTGWAQINGRDELDIAEKARFDGEYVQRMSFLFDCKIFTKTILYVLRTEGIREGKNRSEKK